MISYVLPTRDRPDVLRRTIQAIDALGDHAPAGGAEIVIADNASAAPLALPAATADSRIPLRVLRMRRNISAAARNAGAQAARGRWIVMLDDDSYPLDLNYLDALRCADPRTAVVAAEIFVPAARAPETPCTPAAPGAAMPHEAGGLPEVFIGCGAAIRREAFLDAGGYDPAFDYYAEEYDLSARLLLAGWSIAFDRAFRVMHHKVAAGRDMNRILRRLVRNNGWVARRYAPAPHHTPQLQETIARYARIARKERAVRGYLHGLAELSLTLLRQQRRPMPTDLWDRFTGLAAARLALRAHHAAAPLGRVALLSPGKNAWAVLQATRELSLHVTPSPADADTLLIGTLSPGPMIDALARARAEFPGRRIIAPWTALHPELVQRTLPAAAA